MPKTVLCPRNLNFQPRPTYPYSPGTTASGLIFTAGQVAWDENARIVGPADPWVQTRQALSNIASILAEGNSAPTDIVVCTVYLSDMRYRDPAEQAYKTYFEHPYPPFTLIEALLAEPEMLVEIEAVAATKAS